MVPNTSLIKNHYPLKFKWIYRVKCNKINVIQLIKLVYSIYTDRGNKHKYEDFCKHLLTSYEMK